MISYKFLWIFYMPLKCGVLSVPEPSERDSLGSWKWSVLGVPDESDNFLYAFETECTECTKVFRAKFYSLGVLNQSGEETLYPTIFKLGGWNFGGLPLLISKANWDRKSHSLRPPRLSAHLEFWLEIEIVLYKLTSRNTKMTSELEFIAKQKNFINKIPWLPLVLRGQNFEGLAGGRGWT